MVYAENMLQKGTTNANKEVTNAGKEDEKRRADARRTGQRTK